ncbi:MAG: ATP-dependent endonuclease [Actinomycetota bacterium]
MADTRRYESGPDATIRATEEALTRARRARSVILVEGISDQIALETIADLRGRDLEAERIVVVPIGGAHAVHNLIRALGDTADIRLSGLVDDAEVDLFTAAAASSPAFAAVRIHVCVRDLEDELIRAIEPAEFEALLDAEGDLGAFRTMQKQPGWRDRPFESQMHRWLRSISGRTNRYADRVLRSPGARLPAPLVAAIDEA